MVIDPSTIRARSGGTGEGMRGLAPREVAQPRARLRDLRLELWIGIGPELDDSLVVRDRLVRLGEPVQDLGASQVRGREVWQVARGGIREGAVPGEGLPPSARSCATTRRAATARTVARGPAGFPMNWEAAPAAPAPSAASTRRADSSVRQAAASPTLTRTLNDELTRPRLIAPARRGRPLAWPEARPMS
jgi:hypothetical protein